MKVNLISFLARASYSEFFHCDKLGSSINGRDFRLRSILDFPFWRQTALEPELLADRASEIELASCVETVSPNSIELETLES